MPSRSRTACLDEVSGCGIWGVLVSVLQRDGTNRIYMQGRLGEGRFAAFGSRSCGAGTSEICRTDLQAGDPGRVDAAARGPRPLAREPSSGHQTSDAFN